MRLPIAISLFASCALLCAAPARSAPLGATLLSHAPSHASSLVQPAASKIRSKALIVNHGRLCFWKENNGTQLGISGFCHWSDDAPIGSSCTCERTVEHNHQVHAGAVIEAPRGSGASSGVH